MSLKQEGVPKVAPEDQIESECGAKIETLFKVQPPLEKLKSGFGYLGVILRDTVSDKIQCHICGKWFKLLSTHLNQAHGISSRAYKFRFGLPLGFPLCGISFSKRMSDWSRKRFSDPVFREKQRLWLKRIIKFSYKKASRVKTAWYAKNSAAWLNKHAICKEQVLRRYLILADNLGREPSNHDIHRHEPGLHKAIRRHWSNFNCFKTANGFSTRLPAPVYSDDQLLASLRKFAREHGRMPMAADFTGHLSSGLPCYQTIRAHFGSWNRAMQAAGFYAH
ncbi:MAG TPA: hypothetical protein DEB40_03310 [Elusimicrobia bacterium]|nr:hypothetical protein [Elusimicrobiota bacterium]HBT60756.1 hypothetical protein [Elusimicrobiota bacterium]